MKSSPLSWWQKPLIILGHGFDAHPEPQLDPAELDRLVRWKRRSGFNVEHLLANYSMFEGTGGEDSRAYVFKNFHGYRDDWLSLYLPIARKHGLRVLIYFNCHWFKTGTFPTDHYVVDAAGIPKVLYGDGGEICCRGPFRAWSEKMAEDLGRYPIDGVFLDGPVKDSCWCPHCRTAFQSAYGHPIPENPAAGPVGEQAAHQVFMSETPVAYMAAFARGLHRHNPEAVLYCNGGDAAQMKASLPSTQFIGEEGGFVGYGPLSGEFPFSAGRPAKEMEYRAAGRARVIFCDAQFKYYDYSPHPRGEVVRMYAGTLSNGANPWFVFNREAVKAPGTHTIYRFNRMILDNEASLSGTESLAEAAILESPLNHRLAGVVLAASGDDVHKREASAQRLAVPRHGQEFGGLYAALSRSGYPFDVVDEDVLLEDRLPSRIKLLVLPGVGAMSDALADRLRRFVAEGGRLLATFDTGLYDEEGKRREDFALCDVFGARREGDLLGPSGLDYLAGWDRNPLTAGIAFGILPCPEYWRRVTPARTARPLLRYYEKMPRRYSALPGVSPSPAALLNHFGKGSALFIPSAIGDLSLRYRFPDIRVLLRNAARMLAAPPVVVEGGDEFVETTMRRGADGAVVVHLVNWASGERPSSGAIPLGPLHVRVRLPRGTARPRSVRLAWTGRSVKCEGKGNVLTFTIPRLGDYEMVVVR